MGWQPFSDSPLWEIKPSFEKCTDMLPGWWNITRGIPTPTSQRIWGWWKPVYSNLAGGESCAMLRMFPCRGSAGNSLKKGVWFVQSYCSWLWESRPLPYWRDYQRGHSGVEGQNRIFYLNWTSWAALIAGPLVKFTPSGFARPDVRTQPLHVM